MAQEATFKGDVSELSHSELRSEHQELSEQLLESSPAAHRREKLHDRVTVIWRELKSRVDETPPECPDCDAQHWTQNPGDAKRCSECGKHLSMDEIELVETIENYWETVLSGGTTND